MKTLPEGRLSKNHRLVYEVLHDQGHGHHLSMAELYELARTRRPGIGFTTVYRALTRLRDQQMITEVTLAGADSAYYELATPPHAHFRCTACGKVEDVAFALSHSAVAELAQQLNAEVSATMVSLQGRCSTCVTA